MVIWLLVHTRKSRQQESVSALCYHCKERSLQPCSMHYDARLQGADYTALGSFGNAEQFGENLVASLDRSFMLKSGFNRPKSVQVGASCSPVPISQPCMRAHLAAVIAHAAPHHTITHLAERLC